MTIVEEPMVVGALILIAALNLLLMLSAAARIGRRLEGVKERLARMESGLRTSGSSDRR